MITFRNPIPDRPRGWLAVSFFLALCGLLSAADLGLEVIGSWPLPPRGPAQAVAVSGGDAYVAAGGLLVLDISNPTNPQPVGGLEGSGYPPGETDYALAVAGNYAYLAEGTWHRYGLQVIDISNPANPRRAGACAFDGGGGYDLAVSGNYAYVAGSWLEGTNRVDGQQVIDISTPTNPQRVGSLCSAFGDLVVSGNYVYVAGRDAGLEVIDISNPALPRLAGTYDTTSSGVDWYLYPDWDIARDVVVSGHRAYVADGCYGLQVIDFSNPDNPQRLGGCDTEGQANALALSGDYAYVADGEAGLQVIDVADPTHPRRVGEYDPHGPANGVALAGSYACVVSSSGFLQVIDISDPTNPRQVGAVTDGSCLSSVVAVSGSYAYVIGHWSDGTNDSRGLQVIDLSNPASPRRVGGCPTRHNWGMNEAVFDVAVRGHTAFVVSGYSWDTGNTWLEMIDVLDPGNPQPIAAISSGMASTESSAVALSASGDCAYWLYSGGLRSVLQVIDIQPANPQRVGQRDTVNSARDVVVSGQNAFVLDWAHDRGTGLEVLDISVPATPRIVGTCDLGGNTRDVSVSGDFAYVADYDAGLLVIDIADPAHPHRAGVYPTQGSASSLAVSGHYAFLVGSWVEGTNWQQWLQVLDISDPASPRRVGSYETDAIIGFESGHSVVASGHFVYLVAQRREDGRYDLQVLDISDPVNPRCVSRCDIPGGYASFWPIAHNYLAVAGNYVYVLCVGGGPRWLEIIDVSDPANPRHVGGCDTSTYATAVAVAGRYAYVVSSSDGLQVIDISDPANPRRVGGNSTFSGDRWAVQLNVTVSGDKVYVAAGEDGPIILNTYQPPPRIESAEFGDDGFHLIFRGEAGRTIWLQRSADLLTWEDWVILTATGQSQAVAGPSGGSHPCQFYRAVGE